MINSVKALTFDVFGTVVDWRSSIAREGERLAEGRSLEVEWAEFARRLASRLRAGDAEGAGGRPAMDEDRSASPTDPRRAARSFRDPPRRERDRSLQQGVASTHPLARLGGRVDPAARAFRSGNSFQRQYEPAGEHGEECRSTLGLRALSGARQALQAGTQRPISWPRASSATNQKRS